MGAYFHLDAYKWEAVLHRQLACLRLWGAHYPDSILVISVLYPVEAAEREKEREREIRSFTT